MGVFPELLIEVLVVLFEEGFKLLIESTILVRIGFRRKLGELDFLFLLFVEFITDRNRGFDRSNRRKRRRSSGRALMLRFQGPLRG